MPGGHGPGLVPQVEAELLLGLRGELLAALRDAELGAGEAEDEEERGCSQQSHGRQVNDYGHSCSPGLYRVCVFCIIICNTVQLP